MSDPARIEACRRIVTRLYPLILAQVWRPTTANPLEGHDSWNAERPWCGQSGSTSWLVRKRLGGAIVFTDHWPHRHFYNRFPDGTYVDFVRTLATGIAYPNTRAADEAAYLASEIGIEERGELLDFSFSAILRSAHFGDDPSGLRLEEAELILRVHNQAPPHVDPG
ncbi:MAG: hypothetical protein QY323_02780 [Patescibacteria group bacterium]|nr:MAG: hypothetical protein QY323_02780 [Patescibacteria group bacterium]